jgi:hypothetical protein
VADLITSTRAKYAINQASFTAGEDTTISALVTAVSKAVKRYCRREFDSQTFDELYNGNGDIRLVLDQYPILNVARVATGPKAVLTIKNTSPSNQRATVAVTPTGLSLLRVASGTSSTDTSVTWGTYPTLNAVAAAVNALGNGWSASVSDAAYGLWASSDLRSPQGALNARNVDAPLRVHIEDVADYEVDAARGWLLRGHRGLTELGSFNAGREGWGWVPGVDNYRIVYTAGYTTVPEDVQEACAQWVALLFWQSKENPAVHPDSPTSTVAFLLDHYRRQTAGRV